MKAIRFSGRGNRGRRHGGPFYFCRELPPGGGERFNFPAAVAGPTMRCTRSWTPGLLMLACSILLLSHPHWLSVLGRRRAMVLVRELAQPLAQEYLIPNAGREWIISSSTVREFVAEALHRSEPGRPAPRTAARDLRGPA